VVAPKPIEYELYLHDLGNLSVQYLSTSENKKDLEDLAERMNFLFEKANQDKQFKAEVYLAEKNELTDEDMQDETPEPCEDCGKTGIRCSCERERYEDR
jgi:hypothetical protein